MNADATFTGAVGAIGAGASVARGLDVDALALLGGAEGARLVATAYAWPSHPLRPSLSLGATAFFVDGFHAGVHAGAGGAWDALARTTLYAEAAVEHFPSIPSRYRDATAVVLAAGVRLGVW